ncbi:ABC transporter ATP-binding protein/permease [Georgenia sp. TF02-10]|nr:ABC transporter ATP-binding protein [Georgenia sp. TF02-10]UNX53642.1 ABC transporter ATP-binding protein/permease [Georgenia sp. TF02-10]
MLAVVLALSVLGAGLALAQPLMVNRVIESVGTGEPLGRVVGLLVALVLAAEVVSAAQQFLLERTAEGVVLSARTGLLTHLLRLPVRVYDHRRAGDLVSRVVSDTTMVRAALTGGLVDALGSSLVFAGSLVAMLLLDPVLLALTLGVVAVAALSVVLASARIQSLTQEAQGAVGRLGAGLDRAVSAIRTIRASGATERETARLAEEAEAAYGYGVRLARVGAVLWPVSGLAIQGSFLAVLGVGGYRVAAGVTTVADLVTFVLFLFMMVMPLGQLFAAVVSVRTALGAVARIREILDLPLEDSEDLPADGGRTVPMSREGGPRPADGDGAVPAPRTGDAVENGHTCRAVPEHPPAGPSGTELVLEHVSFAYRPGHPVLTDVSLAVPRGSTTAIVGPSGGGKSTLLALVERFYDPDRGVVRLDGADLRSIPRPVLRGRVGYVEQDAPVLAGTIRENLVLAAPDADDVRCREVLAAVNLLERVTDHPDGLDATVGDDGAGLSGGERQRLAIARALLAETPLLLLDEPTASLDSRNEQALHDAIRSAAVGRTVLIVAHRLATVAGADQIAVLDRGRLTGTGTHEELLGTSDLYRELARHQLLV